MFEGIIPTLTSTTMITRHTAFVFFLGFILGCSHIVSQVSADPCDSHKQIIDPTRYVAYPGMSSPRCDDEMEEGWYRFIIQNQSAMIPTQCVKNNLCGTELGMFVDMGNQSFPGISETITVRICSSYAILGKWDCCVLSQHIQLRRCPGDFFIYKLKPTDRCPVAYCAVMQHENVNSGNRVAHGNDIKGDSPFVSTTEMIKDQTPGTPVQSSNVVNLTADQDNITDNLAQNLVTVNQNKNMVTENATKSPVVNAIENTKTNKASESAVKGIKTQSTVTVPPTTTRVTTQTTPKSTEENEDDLLKQFGSGESEEVWKNKFSIDRSTVISPTTSHKTSVTPVITAFDKTVTPNQTTSEPSQDIFQEYLALFIILMIIGFLCLILLLSSCMYLYCQRHSGHWDRALAEQYHVTVVPRRDALINESPYSDEVIIQDEKEEKLESTLGSSYHGVNPAHNLSYSNSIKAINDLNNLTLRNNPNDFNTQPLDGTEGLVIPIDQFRPEKDTMNIEDTIL
ncbi:uncharacterized protein LOC115220529 [Argonauta hians]